MGVKRNLRAKTKEGYLYIYYHYVRGVFGKKIIREVKYSDVVYLYEYYLKERQLEYNTLKSINRVLYPTFGSGVLSKK